MKLTKTPSPHRVHDYNLALMKDELLVLGNGTRVNDHVDMDKYFEVASRFFDLVEREAKRLGEQQGE